MLQLDNVALRPFKESVRASIQRRGMRDILSVKFGARTVEMKGDGALFF